MIRNASRHCRSNSRGLVNPTELIVHVVRRDCQTWFSIFLLRALVTRVNQHIFIRMVNFWWSTWLIEMCCGFGRSVIPKVWQPMVRCSEVRAVVLALPPFRRPERPLSAVRLRFSSLIGSGTFPVVMSTTCLANWLGLRGRFGMLFPVLVALFQFLGGLL